MNLAKIRGMGATVAKKTDFGVRLRGFESQLHYSSTCEIGKVI